jgi:hypothetical protein
MTKLNTALLINVVLFQCAWFTLVLGPTSLGICVTVIMFIHMVATSVERKKEILFCVVVVMFGSLADTILMHFQVYNFTTYLEFNLADQFIPIWLVTLWLAFSLTLNRSIKWLLNTPWLFVILLCVFGPLSYYAGSQLNAEQIQFDKRFILVSSIEWGVISLVILGLYHYLLNDVNQLTGDKHE